MSLFNQLEKFGKKTSLFNEKGEILSYEDLLLLSKNILKPLESRKLILILANNDFEFISCYVGCLRKKIIPMLVNYQIDESLLKNLISIYLPSYIFLPKSREIKINNYKKINTTRNYTIIKKIKENRYSFDKNLALLLSTSGSTGSKKFVRISYENLSDNTKNITKYLNIDSSQKTVTTMPSFYTYGLSIINTHLYSGASIFVTNLKIIEKIFWSLVEKYKITSFGGVPYFYEILKKINFAKMNLPDLKYFTQAGGPIGENLANYLLKFSEKNKKKFIIMYGQAEATSRMTYLPYKDLKTKISSVGIPIPGGKIILRNEKNENSKKGEIIYTGKNVTMGYAEKIKDLEKGDENQGVLRTGEIGKKDKDGFKYIIDRKSRSVKLFGHRVNLNDLEKILDEKNYKCLCSDKNNKIIIFYTNKSYSEEMIKYLSKKTNLHRECFKMQYIKNFPINDMGKDSYKDLK